MADLKETITGGKHKIKTRTRQCLWWAIYPAAVVFAMEVLLRLLWANPYLLNYEAGDNVRFHPKNMRGYFKVERLYEGEHRIRLKVLDNFAISDGREHKKEAVCLGGSTTESALVPEGLRWPDIINPPCYNYGVSANTLIDGYRDLRHLVQEGVVTAKKVYIMFGVNDLRAFLLKREVPFDTNGWLNDPLGNTLSTIDKADTGLPGGIRIKDSSLLSFILHNYQNIRGRAFYSSYLKQVKEQAALQVVSDKEFDVFLKELREDFLPKRMEVYQRIRDFASGPKSLSVTYLTQPHAFDEDFTPYADDLRLYPVYKGKKMTLLQASMAMDVINAHTREAASLFGHKVIDVEACFRGKPLGGLFYDSVHYTLKGSRQFAQCVDNGA